LYNVKLSDMDACTHKRSSGRTWLRKNDTADSTSSVGAFSCETGTLFTPTAIVAIVKANNAVRTAGRNHGLNLLMRKVAINCTLDVKNVTRNGNRNKLVRGDAGYHEAAWATTAAKQGDRHKTWTSNHFRLPLRNLRHANTKPISAMVAITKALVINPAVSGAGSIVEGSGPLRGSNLSSRP